MGYKNINRLAKEIKTLSDKIETGNISAFELDMLIENTQDLNERCLILRYKLNDKKTKKTPKKKKTEEIPVLFKIDPIEPDSIHPSQTSLIDIIEEIEYEKKPQEIQSGLFDEPIVEKNSEVDKEKIEKPKSKKKPAKKKNKITPADNIPTEKEVNYNTTEEKVSEAADKKESYQETNNEIETIVSKMNSAPISNLKKAINLNLKFRFIKALFDGDTDGYNTTIKDIDTSENMENAQIIFDLISEEKKWTADLEEKNLLLELIVRRHS